MSSTPILIKQGSSAEVVKAKLDHLSGMATLLEGVLTISHVSLGDALPVELLKGNMPTHDNDTEKLKIHKCGNANIVIRLHPKSSGLALIKTLGKISKQWRETEANLLGEDLLSITSVRVDYNIRVFSLTVAGIVFDNFTQICREQLLDSILKELKNCNEVIDAQLTDEGR